MNIVEKLNLQTELRGLVLFKEGLFLRAYNESAYILTRLMVQNLTIRCYEIKKYNQIIADCAFPSGQLDKRIPYIVHIDFGAHLNYAFNLSRYRNWFELCCRNANIVGEAAIARDEKLELTSSGQKT